MPHLLRFEVKYDLIISNSPQLEKTILVQNRAMQWGSFKFSHFKASCFYTGGLNEVACKPDNFNTIAIQSQYIDQVVLQAVKSNCCDEWTTSIEIYDHLR